MSPYPWPVTMATATVPHHLSGSLRPHRCGRQCHHIWAVIAAIGATAFLSVAAITTVAVTTTAASTVATVAWPLSTSKAAAALITRITPVGFQPACDLPSWPPAHALTLALPPAALVSRRPHKRTRIRVYLSLLHIYTVSVCLLSACVAPAGSVSLSRLMQPPSLRPLQSKSPRPPSASTTWLSGPCPTFLEVGRRGTGPGLAPSLHRGPGG